MKDLSTDFSAFRFEEYKDNLYKYDKIRQSTYIDKDYEKVIVYLFDGFRT